MSHILTNYLIDTHCHLNFKAFDKDVDGVIKNAEAASVGRFIVVGTDANTNRKAIELSFKYKFVKAALGYHPIHMARLEKDGGLGKVLSDIKNNLSNESVVAIGEIGLDYYREPYDVYQQKYFFDLILDLAVEENMPVILHSRQAMTDLKKVVSSKSGIKGVMHCFIGNWEDAKFFLEKGFYLGFNGLITYSWDAATIEALRRMPIDRVLLETDAPYLTPVPFRGKRNEPAYINQVAAEVAKVKNISIEEVINKTTKSAIELFAID
jgi:TatD DNase family protein